MNRDKFTRENIKLDDLHLDLKNPRIVSGCRHEDDCLKALLQNSRSEMLILTKDIAEIGISPFPIMAIKEGGKWIVRDGNRRIAALKMLNNPEKCPVQDLQEEFKKISGNKNIEIPKDIECLITENTEAASQYLERLHKGKQRGVGLLSWDIYISSKNNLIRGGQKNKYSKAARILMWAEELKFISPVEKTFSFTSFSRLVNFSETPKIIEFKFDDKFNPQPLRNILETKKIISRVYSDLNDKEITSRNINTNEDIKVYIKNVLNSLSIEKTTQGIKDDVASVSKEKQQSQQDRRSRAPNKKSWIPENDFNELNNLIPDSATRAKIIAQELSDKTNLNVEKVPNAAAVLARTFIELSLNYYLLKKQIVLPDSLQGIKFKEKAYKVINNQQSKKIITERLFEFYKKFFQDNKMLSLKSLHENVHSEEHHPSPGNLASIWNNIRILIINCWKH